VQIGTVTGEVTELRSVDRDGTVVVQAVIAPSAPLEDVTGGASTKVKITIVAQQAVLTAPAAALVSRLDGSYAVQVDDGNGASHFVTVELLGVSGSKVGIRGEGIAAGTPILEPV
jgi:hypothetical protein